MSQPIRSFRELRVYQEMVLLQQDVFKLTKQWPTEERYSLTDQIRRSSRSMGANVSEAWAKRRYPASFVSKLTDSDGESQETSHWPTTALDCGYLDTARHVELQRRLGSIGGRLGKMMSMPEKFTPRI
jgi:four helix bundle protein